MLVPEDPLAILQATTRMVRTYLYPPHDVESIAMDIVLESWLNGVSRPSLLFIKNRCIDQIRRRENELNVNKIIASRVSQSSEDPEHQHERLDGLLTTVLSNTERQLVAYRYYLGKTVPEIAQILGKSETFIQDTLRTALVKMGNAF